MGDLSTIVFFDGQNLFRRAMAAWGASANQQYFWPSYDVEKLAYALTNIKPNRALCHIRFYTGVPNPEVDEFWHSFWSNKLRYLKSRGISTYKGRLNSAQQEKGVDVSIAVDLIRLTYERQYDVAIIVSQDWDFGPAIRLAKQIATDQQRNLEFVSCFPYGPGSQSRRGIPGTEWFEITQNLYDSCFDPRDYRGKQFRH